MRRRRCRPGRFHEGGDGVAAALDFAAPAGIVVAKVDPLTGYLAGPYCPTVVTGVFPKELAPTVVCPFHKTGASVENAAAPMPERAGDASADVNPEATLDGSPND